MKVIDLGCGMKSIIDDADFNLVSKYKWCPRWSARAKQHYASAPVNGARVDMHRFLMDSPKGMCIDHINHDGLDNRRENLRICTNAENSRNRRGANRNSKSGIRGVYFHKQAKTWFAEVRVNGKKVYLGSFKTPDEAAKVMPAALKKHFGSFAGEFKRQEKAASGPQILQLNKIGQGDKHDYCGPVSKHCKETEGNN